MKELQRSKNIVHHSVPQYWIVSRAAHHSVCIFSYNSTLSRRTDSRELHTEMMYAKF